MKTAIPNKFKAKALLILAITLITAGCAPRYQTPEEQAMNHAAILGAAEAQALSNAQALYPVEPATKHHHHGK